MNQTASENAPDANPSADETQKDAYFAELAALSERMIASFGREFAMGALILAARHIAAHTSQ